MTKCPSLKNREVFGKFCLVTRIFMSKYIMIKTVHYRVYVRNSQPDQYKSREKTSL